MYMLVAIAVTILVIALAWRGIGARTPGHDPSAPRSDPADTVPPDDDRRAGRRSRVPQRDRPKLRGEDKSG